MTRAVNVTQMVMNLRVESACWASRNSISFNLSRWKSHIEVQNRNFAVIWSPECGIQHHLVINLYSMGVCWPSTNL